MYTHPYVSGLSSSAEEVARRHELPRYAGQAAATLAVACDSTGDDDSKATGAIRRGSCEILVANHIDTVVAHVLGPCGACGFFVACAHVVVMGDASGVPKAEL